ncbi:ATP-binding protein [Novispirillum sp. DQ9]|uniref:ATP-binding protein n=1 Tax=Novispirillum sp. DQ9 TaxID=3398612 RepID=UPI003C7B1CE4
MINASFLSNLFDRGALMPHGICLVWRPELLWLHGLSDLLTALAYYSIPFALGVFAWRRRDLQFRWMFVLFGAFILACGTTHLMGLWTLWVPDYGLQGIIKAMTAAASVGTAILLWPLIPKALALPSPSQLETMNLHLRAEVGEREAAERQVRRLNHDLERRVEARTAELRRANDKLVALNADLRSEIEARKRIESELRQAKEHAEQADLGKSRFMAAASHDLRQPVQALVFLIEAVARRVHGLEAVAPLLDHMRSSLDGLQRLLDGLLDLSRLDAGAIVAQPRVVALDDLLARLVKEYEPMAQDRGLTLRRVPTSLHGVTDPVLLERVLRNLIENALRYTRAGGVVVGCRRAGGRVRVRVVDSGIGIPEGQSEAIFEEFFQIGNPERDRRKGLGLGLSIVQRLAAILGHRVTVDSRPARGSCFTIELEGAAAAAAREDAPPPPLERLPRVVLVLEDEPTVLLSLDVMLRDWGCEILLAGDEDEAAAHLEAGRIPDVILADYRLREGRNGIDAVARLRALCGRAVPAALLTGENAAVIDPIAEAAGLAVIPKPVAAAVLRRALGEMAAGGGQAGKTGT